jgi:hypothetical protein
MNEINSNTIVLEIIDKLLEKLNSVSDTDDLKERYLNEISYFKQEILEGRMNVPLSTIEGHLLNYIVGEKYYFDNKEVQELSEHLYDHIVIHDY